MNSNVSPGIGQTRYQDVRAVPNSELDRNAEVWSGLVAGRSTTGSVTVVTAVVGTYVAVLSRNGVQVATRNIAGTTTNTTTTATELAAGLRLMSPGYFQAITTSTNTIALTFLDGASYSLSITLAGATVNFTGGAALGGIEYGLAVMAAPGVSAHELRVVNYSGTQINACLGIMLRSPISDDNAPNEIAPAGRACRIARHGDFAIAAYGDPSAADPAFGIFIGTGAGGTVAGRVYLNAQSGNAIRLPWGRWLAPVGSATPVGAGPHLVAVRLGESIVANP